MAIIVKLQGGLGNQLFQYAFGRHLSLKNNTNLKLDISFFRNSTLRQYALDKFAISAQFASLNEFELLKQKSYSRFNRLKKIFLNTGACYMREENIAFDPSYLNAGPNTALEGYWQCEDYFISSAVQIRKDLEIKIGPSVDNAALLSEIKTGNSISIHVRRGDYQSPGIVSIHGCCTMDYYHEAIKVMASRVDMPFFYIFSDEPDWVERNMQLMPPFKIVDINNNNTAYEDLRLMANCKHHIIANSTFSWWGAWLNPNKDKIVIVPKQWFADKELQSSSSMIPQNWIRL